jgi:hypothetical protein
VTESNKKTNKNRAAAGPRRAARISRVVRVVRVVRIDAFIRMATSFCKSGCTLNSNSPRVKHELRLLIRAYQPACRGFAFAKVELQGLLDTHALTEINGMR